MKIGRLPITASQECGHAIIELALIFPIFVMISFIGLEFSRSLSFSQASVTLSRETASRARECLGQYSADVEADPEAANAVNSCLENIRIGMESFGRLNFPETEIVLSLYRYESGGAEPDCDAVPLNDDVFRVSLANGSQTGAREYDTRFAIAGGGARGKELTGGLDKRTLCLHRALIVAEAFVPYRAITGVRAPNLRWSPTEFYSPTVL